MQIVRCSEPGRRTETRSPSTHTTSLPRFSLQRCSCPCGWMKEMRAAAVFVSHRKPVRSPQQVTEHHHSCNLSCSSFENEFVDVSREKQVRSPVSLLDTPEHAVHRGLGMASKKVIE